MSGKKITPTILLIVILLVLHLYAYRLWIFSSAVLTHGDWVSSLPQYSKELLTPFHVWESNSFGDLKIVPSFYPFLLLEGILASVGFEYGPIERIIFLWPIVFLTPIFAYVFIQTHVKNTISAIVGVLYFIYATYFLIIQTGHLTLMVAFAFCPIAIYSFNLALESKSFFYSIVTGLLMFVISFYEFRALYILSLILLMCFASNIVFQERDSHVSWLSTIWNKSLKALVPFLMVFLLNLYWVILIPVLGSEISQSSSNRPLFGDHFFSLLRSLVNFHPFWTGNAPVPFVVQPVPWYFFFPTALVVLGISVTGNRPKSIAFGILALLGVLLTKQAGPPFTGMYFWLYTHLPGFNFFREASKFYFMITIFYAVLIALGTDLVLSQRWLPQPVKVTFILFVNLILIWNTLPLINGSMGTLFVPRTMPDSYMQINNLITKQNEFSRILWVPKNSRWTAGTNNHPKVDFSQLIGSVSISMHGNFIDESSPTMKQAEYFFETLSTDQADQALDALSIKYVVVPELENNSGDTFSMDIDDRNKYIAYLDKAKYLTLLSDKDERVRIYENMDYKPHIFTTNQTPSIITFGKYDGVMYRADSPSQYSFHVKNIKESVYVFFSEKYSPKWRLKIGKFSWLDSIYNGNYFLAEKYHNKTNVNTNMYLLDPAVLCSQYLCEKNHNGSINMSLTLYYSPQSHANIGLTISIVTFILSVTYFVYKFYIKFARYLKSKFEAVRHPGRN